MGLIGYARGIHRRRPPGTRPPARRPERRRVRARSSRTTLPAPPPTDRTWPPASDYLRQGDVLVVLDLDRLGRRAGELIALIDELDHRGVGFRALNSPMDTTTPAGRAFLHIQAAFAEMERQTSSASASARVSRRRGHVGARAAVPVS